MSAITLDQYQKALDLLSKVELAKKAVELYEEQQRFLNDPVTEIMEKGLMTVTGFEVIPNHSLGRITKYRYEYNGKVVERIITYLNPVESNGFMAVKDDKIILI